MVMIWNLLGALSTRAGMAAVALIVGYAVGYKAAATGHTVRQLRAETAALRADLDVHRAAAAAAEQEAAYLRNLQDRLQGRLDDYENELASRDENNACRLDDADIERLRKLR